MQPLEQRSSLSFLSVARRATPAAPSTAAAAAAASSTSVTSASTPAPSIRAAAAQREGSSASAQQQPQEHAAGAPGARGGREREWGLPGPPPLPPGHVPRGPAVAKAMNNYLGVGIDAQCAYGFHQIRERYPGWFQSQVGNKMWYTGVGAKDLLAGGSCADLPARLRVAADGVELQLPRGTQVGAERLGGGGGSIAGA